MKHEVKKRAGKYRVVTTKGTIARNRYGKSRDGGGHSTKAKALRQAAVLNTVLKIDKGINYAGSSIVESVRYICRNKWHRFRI